MRILGIDPGTQTGLAYFESGELIDLATVEPHKLERRLIGWRPNAVIYEDSRLISHTWSSASASKATAAKIARNIGEIDGYCRIIVLICGDLGIMALGVSPKDKGAKLNAAAFTGITKWDRQCNQHERDAAMVAWRYRAGLRINQSANHA